MDMPKPGAAHQKLSALIGDWTGDETLHPSPWDPAGGPAEARVTNRWVADGFAVVQEYEQIRNGEVTFRGHGVFWYDPERDEYVMHWWDSMGSPANEYRGRLEGNRLTLGAPMPQGGQSRTSWLITDPDAHDFLMEVSPDGENWQPAMVGKYRRHAAAAKRATPAKKKATPVRRATAPTPAARPKAKKAAAKAAKKGFASRKATASRGRGRSARRK
jgi:hypothetical protein